MDLTHSYIAVNQYGSTTWIKKHPRKELSDLFSGRVSKMYFDDTDGNSQHVGYVVGDLWFEVFAIKSFADGRK